jgi:hypothetical protein
MAFYLAIVMIFIIGIVIGGSLHYMWGMIRVLQMLIFSTIVAVPYTPTSYLFFAGSSNMAQLDIFNGRSIFAGLGLFKSEPVNVIFSEYGFSSTNYLPNSGSVFILQCGIVFFYIFKFVLSRILAKRCGKNKMARRVGIWA